jgi:TP901 family phage tail tape measure protein
MAPKTGPAILTLKLGGEIGASFKKSIKGAQKQLSTFNQNVKRSINDAATGAAQGFKNVLRNDAFQASAVAAAGLGAALTGAVRTAADFQSGMLKVKAISGASEEQFRQLTAKAKELGRTTQFSARQASDAMGFLAMAGYNTNQILSATPQMMNLAAAGSIELGEAADIASNILGGMGLKIEDTAMVTDVLAKAASSGNTNIQMMGEAFKYVAPTAAQAGASIQDMGGAMALLGNSGIQASVAGTGLRSVLLNLSGANTEANKAMAKLGVTNKDAAGNMRPMADILGDIEARMTAANMGSAERLELQKKLFGKTAVSTGALLQEASANGELAAMVDKVTNSQGAAAEMAKIQNSGFEGSLKRLASAAEGLAIAFGGPLLGPLATVAETLAAILTPIGSLLTDMPILGAVAGVAVAGFVGFVAVLPIVAAVKGAFIALGLSASGMWAAITGPVGLAIAAVIGVIAIFQLLYNKVEPFRNFVDALGAAVKQAVQSMLSWFGKLPERIGKIVDNVKSFFTNGLAAIKKDTAKVVLSLISTWLTLPLKIAGFVSDIIAHFTGIDLFAAGTDALTSMWEGFKSVWPQMISWMVDGFKNAMSGVADAINPMNWFGGGGDGEDQQSSPIGRGVRGKRAMGGPVMRGGSYLVGERGPELFSPSQSGQILSNSQTSSALSMAPTINITVTESNATADDIAAAVSRAMDDALMEAEAGVRALLND